MNILSVVNPAPSLLPRQVKDLAGIKFERLTVIAFDRIEKNIAYWICQCDCGTIKSIRGYTMTNGSAKSCGCYRKELITALAKEQNLGKTGAAHHNYNKSLSEADRLASRERRTNNPQIVQWIKDIKRLGGYRCFICSYAYNLEAHHLNNYKDFPDERLDLDNGVCLCSDCHKSFHKAYGRRHTTKEQFSDFFVKSLRGEQ